MYNFKEEKPTKAHNKIEKGEVSITFAYMSFAKETVGDSKRVRIYLEETQPVIKLVFNDKEGYSVQQPSNSVGTRNIASRSIIRKIVNQYRNHQVKGRHMMQKINNKEYLIKFKPCKNTVANAGKRSSGNLA